MNKNIFYLNETSEEYMSKLDKNIKSTDKKLAKPYPYFSKWYLIGYIFIGFCVLSLNFDKWFN